VPYPAYLPHGYEIKAIYVDVEKPDLKNVSFFISDEEIDDEQLNDVDDIPWEMRLDVWWSAESGPPSIKCPPGGEKPRIRTDSAGCMWELTDHNVLFWQWRPYKDKDKVFEFYLEADKDISKETLISIARSVQPYWVPNE
jgi:hypothetical protein